MLELDNKFETQVLWRLPEGDRRFVGTFSFDPRGQMSLITSIAFDLDDFSYFQDRHTLPVLLATDEKGQLWTLLDCIVSQMSLTGIQFQVSLAIRGAHWSERAAISIQSSSFRLPYLDNWLEQYPFRNTAEKPSFKWEFVRPEDKTFAISSLKLKLIIGGDFSYNFNVTPPSVSAQYHSVIVLKATEGNLQNLDWFLEKSYYLRNLFSLFLGLPLHYLSIAAKTEGNDFVDILFRQPDSSNKSSIQPENAFLRYRDVSANLASILERWMDASFNQRPVLDLVDGYRASSDGFIQNHLLMLTTAFEVFHRRTQIGSYEDHSNYEKIYQSMVSSLPEQLGKDHRESLKKRLFYGNEFSLRKRFAETLRGLPEPILEYFPRRQEFVNFVVDWRNQLTHYSGAEGASQLDDIDEIYTICRRLEILNVVLILNHCGVGFDQLAMGLARCPRYSDLVSSKRRSTSGEHRNGKFSGVFWDYPEMQEESAIRKRLQSGNEADRNWILARMLDYGRVDDTLRLFDMSEISQKLYSLPIRKETREATYRKWNRFFEVYGTTRK